jgi:nucleotide-binding universal stress UspA family protein
MTKLDRILVPFDFSPSSKRAIEYALFLGQKTGATVDLLHVAKPDKVRGDDDVAILHRGVPGSTLEQYSEEEIQDQLTEFAKGAGLDRKVRLDEIEEDRDVAHCILKTVREKGYDLIVMGRHNKSGFTQLFGSVAKTVAEKVEVPVVTVSPQPAPPKA